MKSTSLDTGNAPPNFDELSFCLRTHHNKISQAKVQP